MTPLPLRSAALRSSSARILSLINQADAIFGAIAIRSSPRKLGPRDGPSPERTGQLLTGFGFNSATGLRALRASSASRFRRGDDHLRSRDLFRLRPGHHRLAFHGSIRAARSAFEEKFNVQTSRNNYDVDDGSVRSCARRHPQRCCWPGYLGGQQLAISKLFLRKLCSPGGNLSASVPSPKLFA
jgi:hypothetical protein